MCKNKIVPIMLIVSISYFIFFSFYPSLENPGLNGDELDVANLSLSFINNESVPGGILVLGKNFPVGGYNYRHGALEAYLLAPFIFFLGNSLEAIRICPIIFGVLTIIALYYFGSLFFNWQIGLIAAMLFSFDYWFRTNIKLGGYLGFPMPFFSLLSLIFFTLYHKKKKSKYFYLALFFLACGLSCKGYFIYFLIGLVIASLICYFPYQCISASTFWKGALVLFISISPLLLFYKNAAIWQWMGNNAHITHEGFVNNYNFIHNFILRLQQINGMITYNIEKFKLLPLMLFWFSVVFLLFSNLKHKSNIFKQKKYFLSIMILGVIIASSFTFTCFHRAHLFILLPYKSLIIACAIFVFWDKYRNGVVRFFVFCFIAICIIFDVYSDVRQLEYQPYYGINSYNNMKSILEWLSQRRNIKPIIINSFSCSHWPLWQGIKFFSNHGVVPEHYRREPSEVLYEYSIRSYQQDSVFLFPYQKDIIDIKRILGDKDVSIMQYYYDKGITKYGLYNLSDFDSSGNLIPGKLDLDYPAILEQGKI